ncbi:transmembrane protein 247-like [Sceloporus undulatus]|uniref:transmembrane protein 247-like n=1 Tax=Sceloporus undulatus TaxID=8520 RepID=UPI001C4AA5CB|nr:transmembrane protein 247-like [Sceloporus undulatus]
METTRESHSSSEFSNFETESVHHTDKEIQADLDHTSNLEGSEYSYQEGSVEFKEMQAGIEFAVQITPIKESKKHREKMDAARDTPASSYVPDDMTEVLENKIQTGHLAISAPRGTRALQQEAYSRIGEASSLHGIGQLKGRQITATDLDLEKMRLDGAMTRLKYRHEDNEKRRQHEEKMAQLRQQNGSRSIGQELHELLQPQNQYALFFLCFVFIHVIYTVRELAFYFIVKHHLFCFAMLLYFLCKKILLDYKSRKN